MAGQAGLVQELITQDVFIHWVMQPDEQSDAIWNSYQTANEEQAEAVKNARKIILDLYKSQTPAIAEKDTLEVWERIEATIREEKEKQPSVLRSISMRWWWAAASVILIVSAIALYNYAGKNNNDTTSSLTVIANASNTIERKNTSGKEQVILLTDGSKVFLKPNAILFSPKIFKGQTREVTLIGEAFFQIAKDAQHPFLAHANNVVTRVLGTSFLVKAIPGNDYVIVAVRTGKVSVFNEHVMQEENGNELILLPNQQVVISTNKRTLTKSAITDSAIIKVPEQPFFNFDYEDVPVADVLQAVEKIYAIKIDFDKEKLVNCRITTSLGEEPLADKINIICKAIDASSEITGEGIIIKGGGCR